MKLSRLLLGVVMLVGLFAVSAKADGLNDPSIIIRDPDGPATPFDGTSALVEQWTSTGFTLAFQYEPSDSSDTLDSLTVDLNDVPIGEAFQCFSDIWVQCNIGVSGLGDVPGTLDYVFNFNDNYLNAPDGTPGPCQNNTPAGGWCPGFIAAGQIISVTLETPEPATFGLLLAGLIPLAYFGRKRWGFARAAA